MSVIPFPSRRSRPRHRGNQLFRGFLFALPLSAALWGGIVCSTLAGVSPDFRHRLHHQIGHRLDQLARAMQASTFVAQA
ncbi:MAG TPA: hypothetical protein VN222_05970 [Novosphingobium sp.]|nr:hypothetical protein [Novosphingobium sp.]